MFKLASGVVLSLGLFTHEQVMTEPQITISPIPPIQGATATITYTGPLPANVTVSFKPSTIPDMHLTIGTSGTIEITIPDTGETMKVTDDDGLADAESAHIAEPS